MLNAGDGIRHPTLSFNFGAQVIHNESDVAAYASSLVNYSRHRATAYQGPFLAVWGSDFQFVNASSWFGQMDLVLAEIAAHPEKYGGATARYTTVSEYFDHLHDGTNLTFPVKRGVSFEDGWPHSCTWR